MDESRLQQIEENIAENLQGWVTLEEFKEIVPDVPLSKYDKIKNYVNNRDKIRIRTTAGTATKSSYFIKNLDKEPFEEYKSQLPEQHHSIFDKWVGKGRSPKVVMALLEYLEDPKNNKMKDVAENQGVCTASITNNKAEMKKDLKELANGETA